jgi:cystathionine beta-lyase/cystathionine gamma-synthase
MAAIHTLTSRYSPGDHFVAGNDLYGGTYRIFARVFERTGMRFSFVDTTQPDAVRAAIQPGTRCVFIETPSNPLLRITDISACAEIAHSAGALLVVDNTFATPYLQQPLALGADIVVHSLTKYLGGHSDAVAGCLVGRDPALREELAYLQNAIGGQLGPMDAFLILRGTKTLAVRMDRHCANAAYIARHLSAHPEVERVIYPGLADHPGHEIARKQMRDFGGMVSCELRGGVEAANVFASSTRLFTLAESLGGVESLIEVPASMTHASIPAERRRAAGLADGLVRFSVGIENARDLTDDIDRALARVPRPALAKR